MAASLGIKARPFGIINYISIIAQPQGKAQALQYKSMATIAATTGCLKKVLLRDIL
jgi:hypothetical protein